MSQNEVKPWMREAANQYMGSRLIGQYSSTADFEQKWTSERDRIAQIIASHAPAEGAPDSVGSPQKWAKEARDIMAQFAAWGDSWRDDVPGAAAYVTTDQYKASKRLIAEYDSVAGSVGEVPQDDHQWLKLYAEAREALCSCNKTDTPEKGPDYDYTCEWCEHHPDGDWDHVESALIKAALPTDSDDWWPIWGHSEALPKMPVGEARPVYRYDCIACPHSTTDFVAAKRHQLAHEAKDQDRSMRIVEVGEAPVAQINVKEMPINRACGKCGWTHAVGSDCPARDAVFVTSHPATANASEDMTLSEAKQRYPEAPAPAQSLYEAPHKGGK